MDEKKTNRLFIGAGLVANWPEVFPSKDVIKEKNRHVTICFLGQQKSKFNNLLAAYPKPSEVLSPLGVFFRYVGMPKRHTRLIAIEGKIINKFEVNCYRKKVVQWGAQNIPGFKKDDRPFYCHSTICRKNFDVSKWENAKINIPFYFDGVHLYQSFENSEYIKLKTYPFVPAFEQIQHTADIAFLVRGYTLQELYLNAQIALSFAYSDFLKFLDLKEEISTKAQIIMSLNTIVSKVDIEIGCPFKAVSFHGSFNHQENGYIEWEMIVDV